METNEIIALVFFLFVMPCTVGICLWLNARWDREIERGYDELEASTERLESLRRRIRESQSQ